METCLLVLLLLLGSIILSIISGFSWLLKPFWMLEPTLRGLKSRYGPIITLRIGRLPPAIFICNRSLAHKALIQNSAVFADRPPGVATHGIFTSNQHNISAAAYGPTWRILRRNLTSEIFHPSRLKSYREPRRWALDVLGDRLMQSDGVTAVDDIHYAVFCLVLFMCFGEKPDDELIDRIKELKQPMVKCLGRRYYVLNVFPRLTKMVMKNLWRELFELRKRQEDIYLPLIRARKKANKLREEDYLACYVDTLLELELPHEKRKLTEDEIISLCEEFYSAGTETTAAALQWIMANIVKYPTVQERLVAEIGGVVVMEEVKEEDLDKMPYLKAVVLEGLRRHPPAHFVLPHSVTRDVDLEGHVVPKNGMVNFMVTEMGWDPEVWEEPMEFKPERFLNKEGGIEGDDEVFDITGSREIKMMPFGVGRRMCPGFGMALFYLEYFVANLVWRFEWRGVEGEDVDLTEKYGFIITDMRNPFKAHISPRVLMN